MQSEEIHPQLGKLAENRLVVVAVPPVGALGEIVERLDAAEGEERLADFIQARKFRRHLLVGHHVAVHVETHAQMFGQAIGAVERADRIAAGNQ